MSKKRWPLIDSDGLFWLGMFLMISAWIWIEYDSRKHEAIQHLKTCECVEVAE